MSIYRSSTELYHYGVLGMKWGVRKARKYAEKSAKYKSRGNTQKAEKYAAKSEKISAKHKRLAGKSFDYTNKQSLGKTYVKAWLLTSHGALKYNEARASGKSRGAAALNGILYGNLNVMSGGVSGVVLPRLEVDK